MLPVPNDRSDPSRSPKEIPLEANGANGMMVTAKEISSATLPAALSSSLNSEGLLRALKRRWLLASTLGMLCGALAAAAAWFLLPPSKVTARTVLHVASLPQYVVFPNGEGGLANFQIYQKTQMALVKNRMVLTAALREKGISDLVSDKPEPLDWLERELKVDYNLGPELLSISMSGDRSEELKHLVNAVQKAYLTEIVLKDKKNREVRLKELSKVAQMYEDRVKKKRETLNALAELLGTNDTPTLHVIRQLNEGFLNRTREELLTVMSDLRKLEEEKSLQGVNVRPAPEATVSKRALDEYLKNEPGYKSLLAKKLKAETDLQDARRVSKGGDNSPVVQRYKNELASLEELLEARRKEIRPQLIGDYQERLAADKVNSQAALQNRIALLRQYQIRLEKDIDSWQKKIGDLGKKTLHIEADKVELQQLEETAKKISNQKEAMTVEVNAPDRVTPLGSEGAYIEYPDELKRQIAAAGLAGAGTLGLVLFLIAWLEYRPRRVHSVDDVQVIGMKLVGTVPALPSRRQLGLTDQFGNPDARWHSILTESVDTARTMLLHSARGERTQVVMVTSATSGEGKTSLSCHLAASLARAGRKTLLLDCDLRFPALHRLFGTPRSPGICEALRGEADPADLVCPTAAKGLCMIAAGRCDTQALQALAQDGFKRICECLRPQYDFIVVDSAPVLSVADSLVIGQYVDAVIFSILHDVSRLPKVHAAQQRLELLGIRMLGAVVSGTHIDVYGPEYQYATEAVD